MIVGDVNMAKKTTLKEDRLDLKFIKECFEYHEDGYLVWKIRPERHFETTASMKTFNTQKAGKQVGSFHKRTDRDKDGFGYWTTNITRYGELGHFKLHRLIFFFHKGYFPEVVDHIDNDTQNNKIENLREAKERNNRFNMHKPKHNSSGFKGVTTNRTRGNYRAEIRCRGSWFSLGAFNDPEKAACVYNYVAEILFGEFCLLNKVSYDKSVWEDFINKNSKFYKTTLPKLKEGTYVFKLDEVNND